MGDSQNHGFQYLICLIQIISGYPQFRKPLHDTQRICHYWGGDISRNFLDVLDQNKPGRYPQQPRWYERATASHRSQCKWTGSVRATPSRFLAVPLTSHCLLSLVPLAVIMSSSYYIAIDIITMIMNDSYIYIYIILVITIKVIIIIIIIIIISRSHSGWSWTIDLTKNGHQDSLRKQVLDIVKCYTWQNIIIQFQQSHREMAGNWRKIISALKNKHEQTVKWPWRHPSSHHMDAVVKRR